MNPCQSENCIGRDRYPDGLRFTDVYCIAPEGRRYITFSVKMKDDRDNVIVKIGRDSLPMLDVINIFDAILEALEEDLGKILN